MTTPACSSPLRPCGRKSSPGLRPPGPQTAASHRPAAARPRTSGRPFARRPHSLEARSLSPTLRSSGSSSWRCCKRHRPKGLRQRTRRGGSTGLTRNLAERQGLTLSFLWPIPSLDGVSAIFRRFLRSPHSDFMICPETAFFTTTSPWDRTVASTHSCLSVRCCCLTVRSLCDTAAALCLPHPGGTAGRPDAHPTPLAGQRSAGIGRRGGHRPLGGQGPCQRRGLAAATV